VADLTFADGTRLEAGQPFTKTWQLRNTGTCTWNAGYALVFSSGDRMNAPASLALSETPPGGILDISVDLTAPSADGLYAGLYEIHNPAGEAIPIGLATTVWVRIAVGNPVVAQAAATSDPAPNPADGVTPRPGDSCEPEQNADFVEQVTSLINGARVSAGLPALKKNARLQASAQAHTRDLACNNIFSHTGSNGSSLYDRVVAAGYSPSNWAEIIFAGGTARQAVDSWMDDKPHRDVILDPDLVEFGAGYSYVAGSAYGGYFTVDFGRP
jgi:uncharacterized protein YkwD